MIRLAWHNLLQLIHESKPLPLSRSQVWARVFTEVAAENRERKK